MGASPSSKPENVAFSKYKTLAMKIVYNTVKFDIVELNKNIDNILNESN